MRTLTFAVTSLALLVLTAGLSPMLAQESMNHSYLRSASDAELPGGFLGWVDYEAGRLRYDRYLADWIGFTRTDRGPGWGILKVVRVRDEDRCFLRASNFPDGKTRELSWASLHKGVMGNDGTVRYLAAWTPSLGSFPLECFGSGQFVRSNVFPDGVLRELNVTGHFKNDIRIGQLAAWTPKRAHQRVLLESIDDD